MSRVAGSALSETKTTLLGWEIAAALFILLFGSGLHFAFELSSFWVPLAPFAPVNESIWEHLKMVFWPGLIFFAIQYSFLRNEACAGQFWTVKALCLILMPLLIAAGWYVGVAVTGNNSFALNIVLFLGAIVTAQFLSYAILSGKIAVDPRPRPAFLAVLLLALSFTIFSYSPPKLPLFEHLALENGGQYGILNYYHE